MVGGGGCTPAGAWRPVSHRTIGGNEVVASELLRSSVALGAAKKPRNRRRQADRLSESSCRRRGRLHLNVRLHAEFATRLTGNKTVCRCREKKGARAVPQIEFVNY